MQRSSTYRGSLIDRMPLTAHDIYNQLNTTFITPLDPEEISRLAASLDDVLDFIDGATEKMQYYGI
ncbi:MAG TPA: DUF47 domain-containing protein, partial [Methanoregula sp.]|nr:DUF47 domain-containing protein [Methanoregula sp.]